MTARFWFAQVSARAEIHPRLCRLTVRGRDLVGFPAGPPDQSVYLVVPRWPGSAPPVAADFEWSALERLTPEEHPVGAHYTVVERRPEVGELDLLVVQHGNGPVARWVAGCSAGAPVALWGPSSSFSPPPSVAHLALVGDETALPAIAAALAWCPPGVEVQAVIEIERADHELPVARPEAVTWVHRAGVSRRSACLLLDEVRRWALPDHDRYVWGAGESRTMALLRHELRPRHRLARHEVCLMPYWRR